MTAPARQAVDTDDTPPEELDRLVAAAAGAAPALVGSRPADRAAWLEHLGARLDAAAEELVPLAAEESHLGTDRLQGELKRTTFQLRLFAEVLRDGAFLQATIDHADPSWPMGARPDLRRMLRPIGPVAVYAASNYPMLSEHIRLGVLRCAGPAGRAVRRPGDRRDGRAVRRPRAHRARNHGRRRPRRSGGADRRSASGPPRSWCRTARRKSCWPRRASSTGS